MQNSLDLLTTFSGAQCEIWNQPLWHYAEFSLQSSSLLACEGSRNHGEHTGMKGPFFPKQFHEIRQGQSLQYGRDSKKQSSCFGQQRAAFSPKQALFFKLKLNDILLCELAESSSRSKETPKENKPEQPKDYKWNVALVLPQRSATASAGAGNMCGDDFSTST